jgi:hypothetical protein
MSEFVDKGEPYWFLPTVVGGTGLPTNTDLSVYLFKTLERNPLFITFSLRILRGDAPLWMRAVARAMASNLNIRGSEINLKDYAHEGYVQSLAISQLALTEEQFLLEHKVSKDDWKSMGRAKRRKFASRLNYITEFDMDMIVEKAWILKSAFQRVKRGEPPEAPKRRSPEEIWRQFDNLCNDHKGMFTLQKPSYEDFWEVCRRIRDNPDYPIVFIKRDALSRNFSALLTPMPANQQDITHVRGSINDL